MVTYSGRNTTHSHKWAEKSAKEDGMSLEDWLAANQDAKDCIVQKTIFDVQWSNCPVEVEEEVKKLWRKQEFDNDNFYYSWDRNTDTYIKNGDNYEDAKIYEIYPIIDEYLMSRGITECLIHWWW